MKRLTLIDHHGSLKDVAKILEDVSENFKKFSQKDILQQFFYATRKDRKTRTLQYTASIYRNDNNAVEYDILLDKFNYVFKEDISAVHIK